MATLKELFTLEKISLFYILVGACLVLGAIKKIYPLIKEVLTKRKDFYETINEKFDILGKKIDASNKVQKMLLKDAIYNMINRHKDKVKTYAEDDDFSSMILEYKTLGNGNSESMLKQWDEIPFA